MNQDWGWQGAGRPVKPRAGEELGTFGDWQPALAIHARPWARLCARGQRCPGGTRVKQGLFSWEGVDSGQRAASK